MLAGLSWSDVDPGRVRCWGTAMLYVGSGSVHGGPKPLGVWLVVGDCDCIAYWAVCGCGVIVGGLVLVRSAAGRCGRFVRSMLESGCRGVSASLLPHCFAFVGRLLCWLMCVVGPRANRLALRAGQRSQPRLARRRWWTDRSVAYATQRFTPSSFIVVG